MKRKKVPEKTIQLLLSNMNLPDPELLAAAGEDVRKTIIKPYIEGMKNHDNRK